MRLVKLKPTIFIAITITMLGAVPALGQQNARETFERARMLDESNQNLSEAIKLYGEVVNHASGERILAARAQFRIGILYERLGRKAEAQRAFQVLVNHTKLITITKGGRDVVKISREASSPTPAATAKVREVWHDAGGGSGAVSEDGRFLAFTDWETGDVGIRDLVAGQTRRLTNKGSWMQSSELALFPILSPDGKQIAYSWLNKDWAWELRIVGTDGSAPRMLYKVIATNSDFVIPGGWTPDGKYIAVMIAKDRSIGEIDLI